VEEGARGAFDELQRRCEGQQARLKAAEQVLAMLQAEVSGVMVAPRRTCCTNASATLGCVSEVPLRYTHASITPSCDDVAPVCMAPEASRRAAPAPPPLPPPPLLLDHVCVCGCVCVHTQLKFAGKQAALAEREAAAARLEAAREESRALQARVINTEVRVRSFTPAVVYVDCCSLRTYAVRVSNKTCCIARCCRHGVLVCTAAAVDPAA
jgi:hypothetical protein